MDKTSVNCVVIVTPDPKQATSRLYTVYDITLVPGEVYRRVFSPEWQEALCWEEVVLGGLRADTEECASRLDALKRATLSTFGRTIAFPTTCHIVHIREYPLRWSPPVDVDELVRVSCSYPTDRLAPDSQPTYYNVKLLPKAALDRLRATRSAEHNEYEVLYGDVISDPAALKGRREALAHARLPCYSEDSYVVLERTYLRTQQP
jgi:hypothetical protein